MFGAIVNDDQPGHEKKLPHICIRTYGILPQLRTIVDAFDLCRDSLLSVRHLNYFIYSAEPRVARNSWARKFGLADDPA